MRLALKILILAVLLASSAAGAAHAQGGGTTPSLPTGTWVARGEGRCNVGQWWRKATLSIDTPDPQQCQPGWNGRVALCLDKDTALKDLSEPQSACIYLQVSPAECASSGPRGKIYECQAVMTPERLAQEVCRGRASAPWAAAPGFTLTVIVDGETCEEAVGFLTVRAPGRSPIWSSPAFSARSVAFQNLQTPADLENAMNALVSLGHTTLETAGDLPEWPDGAARWERGAVHGTAKEGVTHAQWQEWRRTKAPLLVLGLGMETYFLYVLDADGSIREIGYFQQD